MLKSAEQPDQEMENPTMIVAKERMEPAVAGRASKEKTEEANFFPPIPVRKMKALMVKIPVIRRRGKPQLTSDREKERKRERKKTYKHISPIDATLYIHRN